MAIAVRNGLLPAAPKRLDSGLESTSRILDSAKQLFVRDGYTTTNLDSIAKTAGVSRQTLYNQFGSKESVFRSAMERHWQSLDVSTLLADTQRSCASGGADPSEVLHRLATEILTFVDESDQVGFTRLVIAESRQMPWVAESFYAIGKKQRLEVIVTIIKLLTEAGALDCLDPRMAARQFLGLLQELTIWPRVMAVGADIADLPPQDVVIEETIRTFLCRYAAASNAADAAAGHRTAPLPPIVN